MIRRVQVAAFFVRTECGYTVFKTIGMQAAERFTDEDPSLIDVALALAILNKGQSLVEVIHIIEHGFDAYRASFVDKSPGVIDFDPGHTFGEIV